MTRKISAILMISLPLAAIGWDIYAAVTDVNATFSVILADILPKSPMIPYAIGFGSGLLVGHIFWPVRKSKIG